MWKRNICLGKTAWREANLGGTTSRCRPQKTELPRQNDVSPAKKPPLREVIICSDSAAALEALRRGKSKARPDIIIDILSVFFRIGCRSNITFFWVPGHAGIGGNEQVDPIAKQSLNREVDVHISWGRVELREIIKEGLMKEWQRGGKKKAGVDTISLYHLKLKKDVPSLYSPVGIQLNCVE